MFQLRIVAVLLFILSSTALVAQSADERLIEAITQGRTSQVGALLRAGANPNAWDSLPQPVVSLAAYLGRSRIVEVLLEAGADPYAVDAGGWTVLYNAAAAGDRRITERLLKIGLAVNPTDDSGLTSLAMAAARGHFEVARLLMKHGADVQRADSGGNSPLLHAAMRPGPEWFGCCWRTAPWWTLRRSKDGHPSWRRPGKGSGTWCASSCGMAPGPRR
ncbi:MAG: ankyrin repeat domain-containing protein [Verrucomicrobiae bacterium]|nr:ankyrin repeat domain-containing protein [Verrucomicrobiae bacterium]